MSSSKIFEVSTTGDFVGAVALAMNNAGVNGLA